MSKEGEPKLSWQGRLISIQPRIRLLRSFDERAHAYLGYALSIHGSIDDQDDVAFLVGIGKAAQAKHEFRVGDILSGSSAPVLDDRMEPVAYYKTARLKLVERGEDKGEAPPPWLGPPPNLTTYRERGHRRLEPRTYKTKCFTCIWGCRMPVEITVDHWNPRNKRYRFETFCYGPKACKYYRAGPPRRVPGRRGMTWVEEDWVDEESTSHRGDEE